MNAGSAQPIEYHPSLLSSLKGFAPEEKPRVSEWAQKEFRLSPEYSATTNIIELDPFQIEPLDCFGDPKVRQITLCSSTQLMKTLVQQICIAWAMRYEPGPMLFVGFKDDDVKKFAEERFVTMCRDIPSLRKIINSLKSRDASNRVDHKTFKGGTIDFVGSNSDSNLARRTIQYLCMDEVDKYDNKSGEGNRIELARARLARYDSRSKTIIACSPTLRGESDIWAEYEASDQRIGLVECWDCHHAQRLHWAGMKFNSKLTPREAGLSARYVCEHCRAEWTDQQRRWAVKNTFRYQAREKFTGNAGFWINHLYSLMPIHSIHEITEHYMKVHSDPTKHMVWKNTRMAELWEESGERPNYELIKTEAYDIRSDDAVLPAGVNALVAGVDVQGNRLEIQIIGFGIDNWNEDGTRAEDARMHFWVVDYQVIELFEPGGISKVTSSQHYWDALDRLLHRTYKHPSGARLPILCMCIDAPHQSDAVYQFAKLHSRVEYGLKGVFVNDIRTVVCTRGFDGENMMPIHGVSDRETARVRQGAGKDMPIVTLGTGYIKGMIYGMILSPESGRTIHIPSQLGEDYRKQLTAEKKVILPNRIEWKKIYPRNEALDTFVYALGAFYLLRADKWTDAEWGRLRVDYGIVPRPKQDPNQLALRPSYLD